MLENFSERQFQGMVHRTRLERNDSMNQMEGRKKYQQHIFTYIHTKWIFISHMVHYIFLCKSALLFDEKEITYVCTFTRIYMPVKVKDLRRSAVGLLSHLWQMLDVAAAAFSS